MSETSGRRGTAIALFLFLCLCPSIVRGQDELLGTQDQSLRRATIAASAAAAADWISTYHALKYYQLREGNPLLRPIDHSPGRMVTVGALIDLGGITAWNLTLGKRHPKLAAAGLWTMTAFRAYLVVHNIRNERIAPRR
ncbi:MAG TPA: hypothetical protein VFV95_13765 [Vicinamibacterales bacterium]|nr:hypothetical protein [Vicinamibacterales bacterium]